MIAISTTSVTIKRPSPAEAAGEVDPWERIDSSHPEESPGVIATAIRANIEVNFGRSGTPGDTQTIEYLMICDPTDLTYADLVLDEKTGASYAIDWANLVPGLPGLEHIQAGLRQVTGFGNL